MTRTEALIHLAAGAIAHAHSAGEAADDAREVLAEFEQGMGEGPEVHFDPEPDDEGNPPPLRIIAREVRALRGQVADMNAMTRHALAAAEAPAEESEEAGA